jgi:hypothetical protein
LKKTPQLAWILILIIISTGSVFAQDTTKSLAFKNNNPLIRSPYYYRPDLGYQIWQQFKLIQEANAGDVLAQHELGLRSLLGEGMTADTVQAVYWIGKAARQELPSAMYNYAILLINGWGVEWNPFSAFKYFRKAAKNGMIQAQYVLGVLYTDNLIVKRDLNYAYYWINKSAKEGNQAALDVIDQIKPNISQSTVDSITAIEEEYISGKENEPEIENVPGITSPVDLVFIDFDSIADTITSITDSMLIRDLNRIGMDSLMSELGTDSLNTLEQFATNKSVVQIQKLAEYGSPEAQTLIGMLYEKGIYFEKDLVTAAGYYHRALRLDSPKSPYLLWQLSNSEEFWEILQRKVEQEDPEAKFVWYGMNSINYNSKLMLGDALMLLQQSAKANFLPAVIELGLNIYTGRNIDEDQQEGMRIWEIAASRGSIEAKVRLLTVAIHNREQLFDSRATFNRLKTFAENGSVLAQVALAYCYQEGIGTKPSKKDVVKYYRLAAQRGSQYAYRELQKLYDEIRPEESEFNLN